MKPKSILLTVTLLAAVGIGGWNLKNLLSSSSGAAESKTRWFVCSETKKAYEVDISGETEIPIYSPFSGKKTGYPAEACYWTKEGSAKADPTYVLLNSYVGISGPTFCPDCGRLVVGHNPRPIAGGRVPPKQSEYDARRKPDRTDR